MKFSIQKVVKGEDELFCKNIETLVYKKQWNKITENSHWDNIRLRYYNDHLMYSLNSVHFILWQRKRTSYSYILIERKKKKECKRDTIQYSFNSMKINKILLFHDLMVHNPTNKEDPRTIIVDSYKEENQLSFSYLLSIFIFERRCMFFDFKPLRY